MEQGRCGEGKIITDSNNNKNKPNANSYTRGAYGLLSSESRSSSFFFAISKSFEKRYLESNER